MREVSRLLLPLLGKQAGDATSGLRPQESETSLAALLRDRRRLAPPPRFGSKIGKGFQYAHACQSCPSVRLGVLTKGKRDSNRAYVESKEKALVPKIAAGLRAAGSTIVDRLLAAYGAGKLQHAALRKARSVEQIMSGLDFDDLADVLEEELTPALELAFRVNGYRSLSQVGVDDEGVTELLDKDALAFAKERAAALVGRGKDQSFSILETTRESIKANVARAVKEGWSPEDLKEALLEGFEFSEARAGMIARTELATASIAGRMDGYERSGIVVKVESIMADTHPEEDVCDDNAAAGLIDFGDSFPSGDTQPPYHPNCLCDIVAYTQDDLDEMEGKAQPLGNLSKLLRGRLGDQKED